MIDTRLSGIILVLSGPSGAGKSSLCKALFDRFPNHYFSISSTTRKIRGGEIEGVHYNFLTEDQFKNDIQEGNFLEWAEVHGNYYGTSKLPVLNALKEDKLVIFDIDVQGQINIKNAFPHHTTSVFVTTKDSAILKQRLISRGDMSNDVIESRVDNAREELNSIPNFDYLLINDDLEKTTKELINIVELSFLKASLYDPTLLISKWNKY